MRQRLLPINQENILQQSLLFFTRFMGKLTVKIEAVFCIETTIKLREN